MNLWQNDIVLPHSETVTTFFNIEMKNVVKWFGGVIPLQNETPMKPSTDQVYRSGTTAKPVWVKISGQVDGLTLEDFRSNQSKTTIAHSVNTIRNLLMMESMQTKSILSIVDFIPNLGLTKEEAARFISIMTNMAKLVPERWATFLEITNLVNKVAPLKVKAIKTKYEVQLKNVSKLHMKDIATNSFSKCAVEMILISGGSNQLTWFKNKFHTKTNTPVEFVGIKDNKTNQLVEKFIKS